MVGIMDLQMDDKMHGQVDEELKGYTKLHKVSMCVNQKYKKKDNNYRKALMFSITKCNFIIEFYLNIGFINTAASTRLIVSSSVQHF